MKRGIILLSLLISVVSLLSAQPRISFDESEHDLGDILWKKPVTVTYTLMNAGDKPLVITNVDASCGCLNLVWTKEPVQPKESGTVSATFDAKMLGHFRKSIGIYSNASDKPVYLSLKGVVRSEITDYSKEYPIQVGSVYMDKNHIEFPDVNRGEEPVAEIEIINASDKEYEPVLMHLPAYLEAEAIPEVLAPKRPGKIRLTLRSDKLMDLGLTHTSVYLSRFPGDKVGEENEITVMAVLLPDFSKWTDSQRALAPNARLSVTELNLILGTKKSVSQTVVITNTGKSMLEFRALQVTDPSVNVSMKKRSLKPGESMKMKITAVAKYAKKRKHTSRVLMITNDPNHPKVEVKVHVKK